MRTKCVYRLPMLLLSGFVALVAISGSLAHAVPPVQAVLEVTTSSPYVLASTVQTLPVKVSLTGFDIGGDRQRAPVNVAIILDRSGSMGGEKIARAKEAAEIAVSRLSSDDILSVITYDDQVKVVVAPTKLRDRESINKAIRSIEVGGSTALFAGVSQGAQELRKFFEKNQVNRIVLLSDGMANVGPSSTAELGDLGTSLGREGITVTTLGLGLGYNEDLMVKLAAASDGNHAFIENASNLASIFGSEFGNILSVVANDVQLNITCGSGVRPVRVLGYDAEINGQDVSIRFNQLYAKSEKYVILEVEVAASEANKKQELAKVDASYLNLATKSRDKLAGNVAISFTTSKESVTTNINKSTASDYYQQIANQRFEEVVRARDAGKKEQAKEILKSNTQMLESRAAEMNLPALEKEATKYKEESKKLDSESWDKQRKEMTKTKDSLSRQQKY